MPETCLACGDEMIASYCHNKQCSRHGRTNDYLRDKGPTPLIEATEDHPAIYRDGKRLVAGNRRAKIIQQRHREEGA